MATAKRNTRKAPPPKKEFNSQMQAIILFTVGILLLAIALIKGQAVWLMLHNTLYGIFGITAILVPIIVIYIAIMTTMGKSIGAIGNKLWQSAVLTGLICGFMEIIQKDSYLGDGFLAKIGTLFARGQELQGGGVYSIVLGYPLKLGAGKTGAIIIIVLLFFAFIMLLTGTALIDLLRSIKKPVKHIGDSYTQKREEIASRPPKEKKSKKIDINIGTPIKEEFDEDIGDAEEILDVEKSFSDEVKENIKNQKKPNIEELLETDNDDAKDLSLEDVLKNAVDEPTKRKKKEEPIVELDIPHQEQLYTDSNNLATQYRYPPISLLKKPVAAANTDVSEELRLNADILVNTLKSFGVQVRITEINRGPTVTQYELQPSAGVKISKITGLADDIALNLASAGVRIEAPIPNKAAVGIEVPNKAKDIVTLREIIDSPAFKNAKSKVTVAIGKNIAGEMIVADIASMPHTLIAGSTGSGKSICVHSIITSILYKATPSEVRFIMVDPKMVELALYNGIPHLLVPVVTDPRKAAGALSWAVTEMLKRYKMFESNSVSNITGYNEKAKENDELEPMPQIVIIIDELADLMMAASNEVEDSICRLAQMARAAGMHLVIATQRPTVDVITGLIKANIPSRIALSVMSQIDSRTILDSGGAEKLLGKGDMLFYPNGFPKPVRVQGCYVSEKEISEVVSFVKNKQDATYDERIIDEIEKQAVAEKPAKDSGNGDTLDDCDSLIDDAIACVMEAGQASTSYLQRKLKVGYARAARIMDELEAKGIIGPFEGSKPRQILITRQQFLEMTMNKSD